MSGDTAKGIHITVKVVPGSSRTEIAGLYNNMLKIKVAAVAEKGRANKALLEFLARQLGIRKNALRITSGQTSGIKHIWLEGVTKKDVEKLCP
ncbi:MAG: DUF167 domain-containing protein [Phycisphaerae bacterium]|nr:DUF167 domain-containing protein [Phycisphaerae bacterium]